MTDCTRCGEIAVSLPESGDLYVSLPEPGLHAKIAKHFEHCGIEWIPARDDLLKAQVGPGDLDCLFHQGAEGFSAVELEEIRCLLLEADTSLAVEDLFRAQPLGVFLKLLNRDKFSAMLRDGRYTTVFQPIVASGDTKLVYGHECLFRGFDDNDNLVSHDVLSQWADDQLSVHHFDRIERLSAIACANDQKVPGNLFINFNPNSIYDPKLCLGTTVQAAEEAGQIFDRDDAGADFRRHILPRSDNSSQLQTRIAGHHWGHHLRFDSA